MRLRAVRELSRKKRGEGELDQKFAQRTEELAALVDSIPGLVGVFAADGEVEFVNRQLREYCGKTLEDFSSIDAVHPDDLANVSRVWRRAVEAGQSLSVDHRLRRADGAYRWFHAASLPLRDADGQIVRWHILLTDIHERKIAEEKLREDEAELRRITDAIPDSIHVFGATPLFFT